MQHITIKLTLYLEKRKAKNDTHIHAHKKNIQIKKKNFMVPFYGWGSTAPRLQFHFEEAVYFLPLSSLKFLVIILSASKG